jgi:hypothetical protein
MSLMYSTVNDQPLNMAQLNMIPTPEPRGRHHRPYPFGQYVEDVHHALDQSGIAVLEQEFAVTKDHGSMFGLMEIGSKPLEGELITAGEWNLMLGLRGSHNQRIGRGLVLGNQVIVCSNLMFTGNVANFTTRQTTNIARRLPGLIYDAVQRIPQMAERQEKVFDAYHNREIKPRAGDAALVEIYRRDGMNPTQLGRAIQEWHEPCHDEHAADGWNAWRLMNSVTESLKPTGQNVNMDAVAQRSEVTSTFLNEVCGIDF